MLETVFLVDGTLEIEKSARREIFFNSCSLMLSPCRISHEMSRQPSGQSVRNGYSPLKINVLTVAGLLGI